MGRHRVEDIGKPFVPQTDMGREVFQFMDSLKGEKPPRDYVRPFTAKYGCSYSCVSHYVKKWRENQRMKVESVPRLPLEEILYDMAIRRLRNGKRRS